MAPNRTPICDIVDYWSARIDECDLSVDWSEADEYCWNCGSPKELTRCHIVPRSLGGEDVPSNYVVLCRHCHEQAPNVEDQRIMWDWLFAQKTSFYKTYWVGEGIREYEFIYRRSLEDEIKFLISEASDDDGLAEHLDGLLRDAVRRSTVHFGQAVPNPATVAGQFRMALQGVAKELGLVLPDARGVRLTDPGYFS